MISLDTIDVSSHVSQTKSPKGCISHGSPASLDRHNNGMNYIGELVRVIQTTWQGIDVVI